MSIKNRTCAIAAVLWMTLSLTAHGTRAMQQQDTADSEQLLSELRDPQLRESEPERVFQAISQLGKMKSIAAIDDLVNLLPFERDSTAEQPTRTPSWKSTSLEPVSATPPPRL